MLEYVLYASEIKGGKDIEKGGNVASGFPYKAE